VIINVNAIIETELAEDEYKRLNAVAEDRLWSLTGGRWLVELTVDSTGLLGATSVALNVINATLGRDAPVTEVTATQVKEAA
jgi:hypothetical protein